MSGILAVSACDFGHLGNPLTLPARGAVAVVENSAYASRRREAKTFLKVFGHRLDEPDIQEMFWPHAHVPERSRAKVLTEIAELSSGPDWAERATVIAMVHQ